MSSEAHIAALEALLFIHGEPLTTQKIAKLLHITEEDAEAAVQAFGTTLGAQDRGLTLVRSGKAVQLATKPAFGEVLANVMKEEFAEELTPASVETLAVVAYFGPLSRARVEVIRGVNSSFTLRNLLLRGLLERTPDPERPFSFLYTPSFAFLRHMGITQKEELPEHEKFTALLQAFESGAE